MKPIHKFHRILIFGMVFVLLICACSMKPNAAHTPDTNPTYSQEPTSSSTNNTPTLVPTQPSIPTPTVPTTVPTEPPTEPPTVPTEPVEPSIPETRPTEPEVVYREVNQQVYATSAVNVRTGPGTEYDKVGALKYAEEITRIGIGDNNWSKVIYKGEVRFVHSNYLSTEKPKPQFPITYSDESCTITITREWKYNAWCYIAHLEFTDYTRLASSIAKNNRGSFETTSSAAKRQNAIFCVNGPYNWGELKDAYAIIRNGVVYLDKKIEKDLCVYNANTGLLMQAEQLGIQNMLASEAVAAGLATDTFKFWNSTLVLNGTNISNADNNSRAQRTFITTNENPGDIYVIVCEGRYADGESAGLTKYECAKVVLDLGCTYGVMLDGGGSSTMYFNGKVLNSAAGKERAVVDFLYFRKP